MDNVSSDNSRSRPQRQAILILGMHRSGASALAGVVRSLGAAAPKTLLMPDSGSPSGYWESVPLATTHDELLTAAGSHWNDWRQLNPEWIHSNAAQRYKERIRNILLDEYGDAPLSFIKDPRVCRFVPFLSAILSEMKIGAVAFLMFRNPLEIALSLRQREGIALTRGLMLWLRYVLDAEYHSRHMPRYFLTYDDLLMDWRPHLDRAAEKVGIVWPARFNTSAASIGQFPPLDLHRETRDFKALEEHPDVPPLVGDAYRILRIMSAGGESPQAIDQIDLVRTKFEEACDAFGPMTTAGELAIETLDKALKESEADRTAQFEQIKTLDKALRKSDATLKEAQLENRSLQLENRSLKNDLDSVYNSRSWRMTTPLRAIGLLFRRNGASTGRE
jgi:hypothetical protein